MKSLIRINNKTKYGSIEFFTINCVDTCLEVLKDDMLDDVVVNILPVKEAKPLFIGGGASHNIKIVDEDYSELKPPNINQIISEINICNDIKELYGEKMLNIYFEKRFFDFMRSIDVEINEYSIFTMILLHEIGHCNLIKLFLSLKLEDKYDSLYNLNKAVIKVIGSYDLERLWKNKYRLSLFQTIDVIESHADIYALKKFPLIWKKVKKFICPELKNKNNIVITRFSKGFNEDYKDCLKDISELHDIISFD